MPAFGINPIQGLEQLQGMQQQQQARQQALAPRSNQSVMDLLGQGPSQQQQDLISQMIQQRFQQGSQLLQQQAGDLSATLSSSAAARGLGTSSIGLGQQGLLGRSVTQQLGNLQGGLQTAGAQQLFQLPQQNAQLAMGLRGQDINRELGFANIDMQRQLGQNQGGGGLGGLLGMATGSLLGPFGAVAGNFLGNQLFPGSGTTGGNP